MLRPLAVLTLVTLPAATLAAPTNLAGARAKMVADMARLDFEHLGNPVLRWDWTPPVYAPAETPHKLLVVMVEFPDKTFERFAGEPKQGEQLAAHYRKALFDPTYKTPNTLSHYYLTQSLGSYHLQGQVLQPVTLSKARAEYGRPSRPEGGDWRNDADPQGLVEDALALAAKANPDLDWDSFDRWDPSDYDGDGLLSEKDGYLDHLVIIYAGGGQSSCQGLYKLNNKLNPNVDGGALKTLGKEELECADRIWPHRFVVQKRQGQGPLVEGLMNAKGGTPFRPGMWAHDYNMQSEFTEASTFIHEFGHSLGLPDIYARTSSNSTGGWEVMSATASPSPQNMSAWSRMMLGWLRPKVVLPPEFGGKAVQSAYLRTLDDPIDSNAIAAANQAAGLWRGALVILPPKVKQIDLVDLKPRKHGQFALYSGQGNDLARTARLDLDLTEAKGKLSLSYDAWFEIEGGWDFAYFEASTDGETWQRLLPTKRKLMAAKHGHDGKKTLPGFTGFSGDMDGDGKNENNRGCKPKQKIAHGEDAAGAKKNKCLVGTWVRPSFDLSAYAGKKLTVRWLYFTDMAAVKNGLLIDNLELKGAGKTWREDFEGKLSRQWKLDGFTRSSGHHTLLVPHYYLLEHRDPDADASAQYRYDAAIGKRRTVFFHNPETGEMNAMQRRARSGVVAWYYDGAYAWSENDPGPNGQGKGFLLALDANPNELNLPGWSRFRTGTDAQFDTAYAIRKNAEAQPVVQDAFWKTMCFTRNAAYYPKDLPKAEIAKRCAGDGVAAAGRIKVDGKPLLYGYELINGYLPGAGREQWSKTGEMLDYKKRGKKTIWRLRDRGLRYYHTQDAPFSLSEFKRGAVFFKVENDALVETSTVTYPAVSAFSDTTPRRWANPKLPFGGVTVPSAGFGFKLAKPKANAPKNARVKIYFTFD